MKKIFAGILIAGLLFAIVSCSDEPEPKFRVLNDRENKANVQIKTSGGSTININDVAAHMLTEYQTVAQGNIEVTAVIQNESVSPSIAFFAERGSRYTIVVRQGLVASLRVDRE